MSTLSKSDCLEKDDELKALRAKLKDKFGPIPFQVEELFNGIRLRWICKRMGIERLSLKKRKLRCYFVNNPQSSFYETKFFRDFLTFISKKGPEQGLSLKQSKTSLILIKEGMNNLKACRKLLENLEEDLK